MERGHLAFEKTFVSSVGATMTSGLSSNWTSAQRAMIGRKRKLSTTNDLSSAVFL